MTALLLNNQSLFGVVQKRVCEPRVLLQEEIELSSFLIVGVSVRRKYGFGVFGQFKSLGTDLLRGVGKQVLKVAMNQCFDFLVALDRFDVLKVNDDERQSRQNNRHAKRQDKAKTSIDFSSGLHCSAEDTPRHAVLCQGEVKIC